MAARAGACYEEHRSMANFLRVTMKSYFSKKKAPPEPLTTNEDAFRALSSPSPPVTSPGLKKTASRWKRSKKQVEVKPELNIDAVLPSTEDFRTSLLMPTFTARFSMLRDPDDPNTLIGKASDDSVLQPRRKSRMDFGGLGDIAEVSSIRSQVRPPFAFDRSGSFASDDGYGSESNSQDGGVLGRARPGEGNILFGGRQKVYMIPKAGTSSSRSLGKVRYEDDMPGMSAFQRYRRDLEREAELTRTSDESHSFDFGLDRVDVAAGASDDYSGHTATPNDSAKDLSHSPSMSSYEKKRRSGSTSHSEARSSTVATSVASQPVANLPTATAPPANPPPRPSVSLKRADTKTRRLYEQGLDQHMYEQQASAMTRLNSIQRTRSKKAAPILHSTRSAGNLQEKARQPVYALRPQSPEAFINNFSTIRIPTTNTSPNLSGPASPVTMPEGEADSNALTQALEPGDRGKATAMGAFNKPKQAFDENQYAERLKQLQRSTSNAAIKKQTATAPLMPQRMDRFDFERERSDSDLSQRSGSRSASRSASRGAESTSAYKVFQRAAQMNGASAAQTLPPAKAALPDTHRTFFGDISASDSENEDDEASRYPPQSYPQSDYGYGPHYGRWQPTALPSVSEHPALRSYKSKASLAEEDEDEELATFASNQDMHYPPNGNDEHTVESPVLGAGAATTPLTGLMHHLRQQSNVSSTTQGDDKRSVYDVPEVPEWNPKNLDLMYQPIGMAADSDSRIGSTYTSSNPFDLEDRDITSRLEDRTSRASVSPIDGPRSLHQQDSRAPSRNVLSRESQVSSLEPEEETSHWQAELQRQHTRDTSTATQQERDAFQNELEARKNAAQERIMQRIDQSRNASPAPAPATGANGFKGFGMLRSRPSRESVTEGARTQAPPKAMKMLGLSGGSGNASSTTLNSQYERNGYSLDIGRSRDMSASRPPLPENSTRVLQSAEQDTRREWQGGRSRENSETRPPTSGRSPSSSYGGSRSRANSEVGGARSRSRNAPYRDDLERAMVEGTSSRSTFESSMSYGPSPSEIPDVPDMPPMLSRELTPRPSPDTMQGAFDHTRARSNSRPAQPPTGYFDAKNLQPLQTSSRERLTPGGPSPITLSPNVYSPAPGFNRTAPPSPFASNMTPPLSGASTPMSTSFTAPPPPASAAQSQIITSRPATAPLRKKTISKGDISEPVLIMATSNIDTVDLPEGASLKNGMDETPPPVPPINPRRRATKGIFHIGSRKDTEDFPPMPSARSKTPDPWVGTRGVEQDFSYEQQGQQQPPMGMGMRTTSETRSPHVGYGGFEQSPAMRQNGFMPGGGSPERVMKSAMGAQGGMGTKEMEGGMF